MRATAATTDDGAPAGGHPAICQRGRGAGLLGHSRAFWATHELDELWDQAEPFGPDELPPPRSVTKTARSATAVAGTQADAIRWCRRGLLCIGEQLVERCGRAHPIRQLVECLPIRRRDALLQR